MVIKRKKYNLLQAFSAVFMIVALLWLTISIPFVYDNQQKMAKLEKSADTKSPVSSEEECNPFANSTEEKAPTSSTNTFSEEYHTHEHHVSDLFFSVVQSNHISENADTYVAFHGELLVPPPNVA